MTKVLRQRSPQFRRFLAECEMLGELVEALERPDPDRWREVIPGIYATTPDANLGGERRRRRIVVNLNPLQEQLKAAAQVRDRFLDLQQALHDARNPRRR